MTEPKQKPVCRYCGSDNVTADGPCHWNEDTQSWQALGHVYDGGICQTCGEENKYFDWENNIGPESNDRSSSDEQGSSC